MVVYLICTISHGIIKTLDEVYFLLRSTLSENIPRSLIDEVAFQKEFRIPHPLPIFTFAYLKNEHFKSKKHPEVNILVGEGKCIVNDGVNNLIR